MAGNNMLVCGAVAILLLMPAPAIKDESPLLKYGEVTHDTSATPLNDEWNRTFGGKGEDAGTWVEQTADGGYILVGYTSSYGHGDADVWLIKTDGDGHEEWNRTFGGGEYERGYVVKQVPGGGYIILGVTESFGAGGADVWLIKTDDHGIMQWNRTFGGKAYDRGYSMEQTADGGYVITGHTYSFGVSDNEVWLIKTDAAGIEQWNRTYGGYSCELGLSIQLTDDGGYIIVGNTESCSAGGADVWLLKTDEHGTELWNRTYGGTGYDSGNFVQQTPDGGYIMAGYTFSYGAGDADVWIIKTDAQGIELWNKTYGGKRTELAYSIQPRADGTYRIVGKTSSFGAGSDDVWMITIDTNGTMMGNRTFGGKGEDGGYGMTAISDTAAVVVGFTNSFGNGKQDVWLIKEVEPPKIRIEIYGGFGITVIIHNMGETGICNVVWSIALGGLICMGPSFEGIIDYIEPGNKTEIKLLLFGIGPGTMHITVHDVSATANFLILGPFVIMA